MAADRPWDDADPDLAGLWRYVEQASTRLSPRTAWSIRQAIASSVLDGY